MSRALLHDPSRGAWLVFDAPRAEFVVADHFGLPGVLRSVADAAEPGGLWGVGMLSYEAAASFDPSFSVHPADEFPLAWLALFDPPTILRSLPPAGIEAAPAGTVPRNRSAHPHSGSGAAPERLWHPSVDAESYARAIRHIRELIARGETYQVNYTFRLRRDSAPDPYPLFHAIASPSPPPFAAYLEFDRYAVCSFSPELFFRLDGDLLVSRPMKGTSRRGVSSDDDRLSADRLRRSPKNRAENIMIVDMVRNDMGKVARGGTVSVPRMFDVERYPTVWQMTSTVSAHTGASLPEIFAALFPPASVTGAPKVRTMEIICELEDSPRHVYTGAIGWIAPGRAAQFSVAIRTLLVDRGAGRAEYGVGSGIVWDSDPLDEYEECVAKAAVLDHRPATFSLLETMLWIPDGGFTLLDRHLDRLRSSASYFGIPLDEGSIRERLADAARAFGGSTPGGSGQKVRLLLARDGGVTIESSPVQPLRSDGSPLVKLAGEPVDPRDPFLYHKTTHRGVYDRVRALAGECDDVILWNPRREITESCIASIAVSMDGSLYTPPVACGLLPGIFRAHALETGLLRERVISVDDLQRAERVLLANSVRGLYEVRLVP